ncbi:MAG: LysR family transcriptional regulator [Betaproteobacteria bacterium]|nr:LysR family transcriptional regulator [Betaproteobacteria bacterium]
MKLEMLRIFQVTAEQGSLSRAAEMLGRTPSAVSMILLQLEDNIGGALFEGGRKNRLTPLGLLVLEESRRANEAYDRSVKAIRRYANSTAGSVRIAAVPSATISFLPRVILRFRRERLDVRLEINDVDSAAVRRRLEFDEADIGIVSAAPDGVGEGTLIERTPLGIVCRSDGPIARAAAAGNASWSLLDLEPMIVNPLCSFVKSPIVEQRMLTATLESRNTTSLLAFVQSGLGATILPQNAMPVTGDNLVFVSPTDPVSFRHLLMICQSKRPRAPVVEAFCSAILNVGGYE